MVTRVAIDLESWNRQISQVIGKGNSNGGLVKDGKFFKVSIHMDLLPSFSTTNVVTGAEVRKKIGHHVAHIRLNKKTDKYVIKSKHPEALLGCIREGI